MAALVGTIIIGGKMLAGKMGIAKGVALITKSKVISKGVKVAAQELEQVADKVLEGPAKDLAKEALQNIQDGDLIE